MVSTLFMVDTASHPGTQLHRCVEKSAFVEVPDSDCVCSIDTKVEPFCYAAIAASTYIRSGQAPRTKILCSRCDRERRCSTLPGSREVAH
jgi:hypothetical protein